MARQVSRAATLAVGQSASAWMTIPEIADHYRTTVAVVRYWRHTGYGPQGTKCGNRVLYARAEVDRFDHELQQAALQGRSGQGDAA